VKHNPQLKLQYTGFGYGKLNWIDQNVIGQAPTPALAAAQELTLLFTVTAVPELTPGEQTMSALLSYEVMDTKGRRTPQKLALAIPVRVISADALATPVVEKRRQENPVVTVLLIPARVLLEIGHVIAGANLEGW